MGDGNNIVHSWIRLAAKFDFEFVCACPEGFEPDAATVELANAAGAGRVSVSHDPFQASSASLPFSGALERHIGATWNLPLWPIRLHACACQCGCCMSSLKCIFS